LRHCNHRLINRPVSKLVRFIPESMLADALVVLGSGLPGLVRWWSFD
jgi:hypothetical protein